MAKSQEWQSIPTRLSSEQFQQFVLPHLIVGSRGPVPKLTLHAVFNYILRLLHLACQWKELPIEKDQEGRPEIHYTRIYGAFRKWQADGCFDAIFAGSVSKLHQTNSSTLPSSTAMERRLRRRKAATTSVSADTRG
jgi:transposase